MPTITVDGLEENLEEALRLRAARKGHSMEQEVREILAEAISQGAPEKNLGDAICALFQPLGGIELPEYPRHEGIRREPPSFD